MADYATTAPTQDTATGLPTGVSVKKMSDDAAAQLEHRLYTQDELQGVTMTRMDAPANSVFDQDNNRTLSLPQTLSETETGYVIKRDADQIKEFFGMEEVGGFQALGLGVKSFFAAQPQAAGTLMLEQGELAKNRQTGRRDVMDFAAPQLGAYGSFIQISRALRDATVNFFGADEVIVKSQGIIERNKKYMADAGLERPEQGGLAPHLYDLGQGVGSLLTSLGVAALTRSPQTAGLYFGALQKASVYQEARAAGKTPEQASDISTLAGTVEGALEFVGLDHFIKAMKGNSAVRRFVTGFAIEAIQEGSQAVGEEVITQGSGVRDKSVMQTVQDILYQAALGGVIGGGTNVALGSSAKTEAKKAGLDDATASKIGDYVEKNVDSAKANMTEFIDKELAPIARDEPTAMQFMDIMKQFGNDKELVNRDSLDPATRAVFDQYVEMFERSTTDKTSVQDVEKKFYEGAIKGGVAEDQAVAAAKVVGARADAASRALGVSPMEWLESKNLTVENVPPLRKKDEKDPDLEEAKRIKESFKEARSIRNFNRDDSAQVQRKLKLKEKPLSLMQFIKSKGGISLGLTSEELANVKAARKSKGKSASKASMASGELQRIFDGKKNLGQYVSEKGMALDDLYTALVDGGYIEAPVDADEGQAQDRAQEVLDLIEKEVTGKKVYTQKIESALEEALGSVTNFDQLNSIGIDESMTPEEIAAQLRAYRQDIADYEAKLAKDQNGFVDEDILFQGKEPQEFSAEEWKPIMDKADSRLKGDAAEAITEFVGHEVGTADRIVDDEDPFSGFGIMRQDKLEKAISENNETARELEAAFAPIREEIREKVGSDYIRLYRTQYKVSEGAKERSVLSWTANKKFAEYHAGMLSEKRFAKIITEEQIVEAEKSLAETGEAKIGEYTFKAQPDGQYVDFYKYAEFITDTDSIRDWANDRNQTINEQLAENRKKGEKIISAVVSLDDVVFVTDRAGQTEFIVRNTEGSTARIDTKGKLAKEQENFTDEEILFQDPAAYDKKGKAKTNSAAFKKWFGKSKVVDEKGKPLIVYHGTTHDFTEFKNEKTNIESDVGAGFYFSNNEDDVSNNYAGEGADLANKIGSRADQLQDKLIDQFEAKGRKKVLQALYRKLGDLGFVSARVADMDDRDAAYEAAQIIARKELHGGEATMLPVYLSMQNPVELGGKKPTWLDMEHKLDEETGDFLDEEPTGSLVDFADGLREAAQLYDADVEGAISAMYEAASYESIKASDVFEMLKKHNDIAYAEDPDTGKLAVNEIIRQAFEFAGYDGIIDNTVNDKFGTGKKYGKAMAGMHEGTVHYIVFKPEQIKSVNNKGTFDASNPNILFQFAGKEAASAQLQKLEEAKKLDGKKPATEIWDKTGWFKGSDGQWRYEIDTSKAKLKKEFKAGKTYKLTEVISFPELFEAYPEIQSVVVEFEIMQRGSGMYTHRPSLFKKTPVITLHASQYISQANLRSNLLHEIQHFIQKKEGFTSGAHIDDVGYKDVLGEQEARDVQFRDAEKLQGMKNSTPRLLDIATEQTLNQGKQEKPQGQVSFSENQTLIQLFESANPSTLLHELGHVFLRDMRDASKVTKRPRVKADYEAVKKWLGAKGDTLTVAQEEKFARGFEAYLREGKAPKPELQSVFDTFKKWLESIYKSINQLNVKLTPEIREVFDRMLGGDFAMAEKLNQEAAERNIEADYEKVAKMEPVNTLKPDTLAIFKSTSDLAADAFVPISTRLGNIDEGLKHAVRKFVFNTGLHTHEDRVAIKPFVEKVSNTFSQEDYRIFDLALKNRDTVKVDFLVDKYGIGNEYKAIRDVLDDLYNQAKDVGIEVGYIEDYFPRKVKKGMVGEYMAEIRMQKVWSEIQLAMRAVDPNGTFTPEDEAAFVNTYLRGFSNARINLARSSFTKERRVDYITPEFNRFYEDSMPTLMNYVSGIRHGIESRKLFGKSEKETDDNIGAYVLDLVETGVIKPDQEQELKRILKAVVEPTGTYGAVAWAKNASYIYLMGSPISAITQIQDLAFSLHKNGYYRTTKSLLKSLTGKQLLKKEDIGIDNILREFEDETRASSFVRATFKAVGLEWMDNVGKETYIDAAYDRIVSAAKKGGKEFDAQMETIFGKEAEQTKSDLLDGTMSENVKYLLFSELSDIQPISLAEMPVGYLRGGNGRVFYMLKTYTIKQLDIYRREIFANLASGDLSKVGLGLKNLISLAASLMLMGMGSDALKDLLLGRDIVIDDLISDNILKLMGFTKYQIYKAKTEGIGNATLRTLFMPPIFALVDDAGKDIGNIIIGKENKKTGKVTYKNPKDAEVLGKVPIFGKFYYWWWGGGKDQGKKKSKVSTP